MLALIDADSLIYKTCFAIEDKVIWNEPEYLAGLEPPDIEYHTNIPQCKTTIDGLINGILLSVDADDNLLCISGEGNFRLDLPIDYKWNRKDSRKPLGYEEVRQHLKDKYNVVECDGMEADDYVVWYRNNHDDCILCAIDKDVLKQATGVHFNYLTGEEVETTEKEAIFFAYYQTLTGDSSDGYRGCKGIGPAKASKMLNKKMPPIAMWCVVVQAYEEKGQTYEEALYTMRLANMRQFDGKKIVLWEPPKMS